MAQDDRRSFLQKASVLPLGGLFAVPAATKKLRFVNVPNSVLGAALLDEPARIRK